MAQLHGRRAAARRELQIAAELGVTLAGLSVLARAIANGGNSRHTGGNCGTARTPLADAGLIDITADGWPITDAGREIVRKARELGW
jgi:hypothetical protein